MQMDIQVERRPEALNECDGTSVSRGFFVTGFPGQMRGDGAVNDAQYTTHDVWATSKQKA
jgi:hypothetical protein